MEDLVFKAKNGDRNSLSEILERVYPLIISSIRRNYNKEAEYEDLIQMGYLKTIECVNDYDKSYNTYFLGYLKMSLRFMYLDLHKRKKMGSLNERTEDDLEFVDLIADDLNLSEEVILKLYGEYITKQLNILSKRQKQVIMMYYYYEMNIDEISKKLNISYRTVVNTKVNALKKLKESLV